MVAVRDHCSHRNFTHNTICPHRFQWVARPRPALVRSPCSTLPDRFAARQLQWRPLWKTETDCQEHARRAGGVGDVVFIGSW